MFERLRVSPACPLILASHVALDRAREKSQGANAIGTTGRGIGPAYEDKVARRAVRVADLFHRERFAAKLGEILDYHNFILQRYFQLPAIDFQPVLESNLELGERLKPLVADVTGILDQLGVDGRNVLFEGAQGAMLDVDLGTYPYVTSSTTTAGGAAAGTGLGPRRFHEVLGIVKAYATRVGGGPFPTELFDEFGEHLSPRGARVRLGHRTAAPLRLVRCRCVAPLHRALELLLAVRDQARRARRPRHHPRVRGLQDRRRASSHTPPLLSEQFGDCEAVYEDLPGWKESSVGIDALRRSCPHNARRYLERLEVLLGVPDRYRLDRSRSRPDHSSQASFRVSERPLLDAPATR